MQMLSLAIDWNTVSCVWDTDGPWSACRPITMAVLLTMSRQDCVECFEL